MIKIRNATIVIYGAIFVLMYVAPNAWAANDSITPVGAAASVPPLPPLPPEMRDGSLPLTSAVADQGGSGNVRSGSEKDFSVKVRNARANESISAQSLATLLVSLERHDVDEAARLINAMKPLESVENLDYMKLQAMYAAEKGDIRAAQAKLRRVLEVAPDDENARRNLERVEAVMRRSSESNSDHIGF
ncbi:hypothetical protein [Burkholderia seminalis]|uniref:hypothetical protein n=1 Tax=Burkholderia seminalis TaxID=488731 RepID=UPI00158344C2|nr:hypothetical protein [Burkholderia seminalis]MCA8306769.1 hypothetical protein [Burkholderia seminalis]MCA8435261.1 hypothetical protein [Burkholderia seminalis]